MRYWLIATAILLAGCAGGTEAIDDVGHDPADHDGDADRGANDEILNATDETGQPVGNGTQAGGGNGTGVGTGHVTCSVTSNGTGVAPEPWSGGCSIAFTGVRSGGSTATLGSPDCSGSGTDQSGFASVTVKVSGSAIAHMENIKYRVSGANGVLADLATGTSATGEGTFELQGDEDVSSLAVAMQGTIVGDGDLTIDVALS